MTSITTPTTRNDLAVKPVEKGLLRFIACGSVDDGKSTLIGRLMLDAGAVYSDQLVSLQVESEKHGTNGGEIDTALLLDGLEDEQQQGITIDVAYRYFATKKRKFIIADTPGHEQFTRNMATGASNVDLAILLVDATKGVLTQTKRHAFIVSLLGIKHVVLAVNKMDLVDYDEGTFETICQEFKRFAAKLEITDLRFVPLSARHGENVAEPSAKMLWHADGSLLHQLETVYTGSDRNLRDFRFPVQWVNRPDETFRGFSGTIASGGIRAGEEIVALPSGKRSRVRSIVTMDGPLEEATAPKSVTLTLEDEIDVTRGDMICRPGNQPHVSRSGEAMLVWMSEQPLQLGRPLWFKNVAGRAICEVESLRYEIDVNSLHRTHAQKLGLNAIGRCSMSFHEPVVYDAYDRNRKTGAFILVDRITHETLAAGMFLEHDMSGESGEGPASFLPARKIKSQVAPELRSQRYGHEPFTVLLTGLPASGKTTIAKQLEQRLFDLGAIGMFIDGEAMRQGISKGLGFSTEERSENLRRGAEVAKLLNDSGQFCIAAFCAPEEAMRQKFVEIVGSHHVVHVHLDASVAACRARDTTGRYVAADNGQIEGFPGVDVIYQKPPAPDYTIATEDRIDVEELAGKVFAPFCRRTNVVANLSEIVFREDSI
ncbi:sulfate adenylyltransferase subunit CysN [Bythopirellula goksoeyrii]|uniref:Sulfate adenylyltransferase subunit 1 n=1 Tax=Bythopirellula goksoeyrii TaxID=1400387 RepID=A0A5B9QAL1_9BACT|nr:sulfate adenylyltransferase subunit CysN [Bythopirellula goksoeyrii]QEG36124.1 Bifunctional enzyme CysN/CysC [Bythopirellula goksoeyrii]